MKLYVGSLPWKTDNAALFELFSQYGKVKSATVMIDRESGRSRGFGFVEFEQQADGEQAIKMLNNSEFEGRKLVVNEARPKTDRPRQ